MPYKAVHARPSSQAPAGTLAGRDFPPRVRRLLEGMLALVAGKLERRLATVIEDTEDMLFRFSDEADSSERRADCYTAISELKRGRSEIFPRFMAGLEAALAKFADPPPPTSRGGILPLVEELALVDDYQHHEDSVIEGITNRANVRNSLGLTLLGQRFGVMSARPAFDADRMPVGPKSLCRILGDAIRVLEIQPEHRIAIFRQFDRIVFAEYAELVDALNAYLIREDVLASLQHVPVRSRGVGAPPEADEAAGPAREAAKTRPTGPHTTWPGEVERLETPPAAEDIDDAENAFGLLQQLLAMRRAQHPGEVSAGRDGDFIVSREDINAILGRQQRMADGHALCDGAALERMLLDQLRLFVPAGKTPVLDDEDADTLDLVCMLFAQIMTAVRPDSPAANLLVLLQIPTMRVALYDKRVFVEPRHPARQLINVIAESGAKWRGEQDTDHALVEKLRTLVMRVVNEYDGETLLFDALLDELDATLKTMVERARVSERRYVEAARGREKLALARIHANERIAEAMSGRDIPSFVGTLLTQAWADVLALTALRQGSDSDAFHRQAAIAGRLAEAATSGKQLVPEAAAALAGEIRQALEQVGYHGDDAEAIATALTRPNGEGASGIPAGIEERLQARSRLGEQVQAGDGNDASALSPAARPFFEQVRHLPFGTWMEFAADDGQPRRSRLSWYSVVTGQALFVNSRGLRVGEHTLAWMAEEMAAGRLYVVQAERGPPVDQAWNILMNALDNGTTPRT